MELISIVIPVYNHQEELKKALGSIAEQTYENIEVIIIDDGSKHDLSPITYNLSSIFDKKNKHLDSKINIVIMRQQNLGAPSARNKGFGQTKGEYIIFWDADIIAERDMLKKMHNVLTIHPEADYCYSSFTFGNKKMPGQKFDQAALKENNYIHSTSLIRREAVVEWDESLKRFQDWDLWLSMLEKGSSGIWIPEYLFKVLPRESGISTWLPSFTYKKPFKLLPGISRKVAAYEEAKSIVKKKHKK